VRLAEAVKTFSAQPWSCLVLAGLAVLMGALFLSGLLPPSRKYLPVHDGIMALACWGLALCFAVCAGIGFRRRRQPPRGR